ncbi:PxxKW family cysteine-rich protein [Patescibacteria group bacterium]|nr:PxxKW family cysteine-rich protein [Patescibacteria group bacterium]MBU2633501.1 PxxKW family cysteine-rich protein [Patescibacteria group bacterium]
MECKTVKEGNSCHFMTKAGCGCPGGSCKPIVDECKGCRKPRKFDGQLYCSVYADPAVKWGPGNCPVATHIVKKEEKKVKMVNPIKQAKRRG